MLEGNPSYPEMSYGAKWVLILGMIVGRLELLALVALFSREQWRN